jgi:hypothetical protein
MEVAMPGRSALVPKYCLHKPSGRAYVRIRGKVIYVGVYGAVDSKREYGRLIAELAVNSAASVPTAISDLTVVELAAAGNSTDNHPWFRVVAFTQRVEPWAQATLATHCHLATYGVACLP